MKKSLLLISMAAAGLCAQAFTNPETYAGASWQGISPNGQYLESDVYGTMVIYDLTTGLEWTYEQDYETGGSYSAGNGNNFSATGILVGSTTENGTASYWKDGEWHQLFVTDPELVNLSNGITPDGRRICGGLGTAELSLNNESTMMIPCIWDVQADGTYGEPVLLPYPEADPSGRAPQYVTTVAISSDGKTIIGQMTDAVGMLRYPIIFTESDNGEWSYKLLLQKEMCPESIVFPEFPGESPDRPQMENFMTAEEKASYDAAIAAWQASGYSTPYPEAKDYMTTEEYTAYEQALAEYQPLYDAWEEANTTWYDKYYELLAIAYNFELNSISLTPDGKSCITTVFTEFEDPMAWFPVTVASPAIIDIASDTLTKIDTDGKSIQVNFVANDNIFLGTTGLGTVPMTSYIITSEGTITEMADYLKGLDENFATWIDENLKHEVAGYEEDENGEYVEVTNEYVFTGAALASTDMKTLALWTTDDWSYEYPAWGYVLNLGEYNGVKDVISAGDNRISFDANGNLNIEGDGVQAITVYDLQGRKVLDSTVGEGAISNDLRNGIYIIRATIGNGASFSSKIVK